jgi:hypothetical protein
MGSDPDLANLNSRIRTKIVRESATLFSTLSVESKKTFGISSLVVKEVAVFNGIFLHLQVDSNTLTIMNIQ